MSEQYEMDQNSDSSGQTEGGGGGEENNEADMIFTPEASKPGRNAGMLMIAFVMIGVGVIYFMRARTGPNRAVSAEVAQADSRIKDFIKDGNQVKKMKDLLDNTQKVVDQFNVDRTSTETDKKLELNPFKFTGPNDHGPSIDPNAKDKARERAKLKFVEGLGNLRVQYLMVSAFAKTAMINNKLVQEGQEVEGYTIDKITPSLVNVSRTVDGYEFKAEIKTSKELK